MTPSRRSDTERELNDLRARAYGPKSDIEADPAAIARLIELEAAHIGAAGEPFSAVAAARSRTADPSLTAALAHEADATGPRVPQAKPLIPTTSSEIFVRRAVFIVGSIVLIAMLIYSATWLLTPHPDATLQRTSGMTDITFLPALDAQDEVAGISAIRQFERYHDIDVWSVETSFGKTCLIAWDRMSGRFQFQCNPPATELALEMSVGAKADDGFGEWLPDGSMISIHLRENTVDVFVHPPPQAT